MTQIDILAKDKMYAWVIYGQLFCPEELAIPGAFDICRVVLSQVRTTSHHTTHRTQR
jgi:hypothetical protein